MRVHFIAIGGSAMHNLAIALHKKGYEVTGSDDEVFEPSKSRLQKYGLLPNVIGWNPEIINDNVDAVILGMHAREDNPELQKARKLGLKIYSYPEYLYEQSKNKTRVVIGGSHGKTTITSMLLHVLDKQNMDYDYMVGAQLEGFDTMVKLSDAPIIVLEGDEYLSSPIDRRPKFHLYKPNIALLSGIAWDHINVFPTFDNYVEQFAQFVDLIEPGGSLIYYAGDKNIEGIVKKQTNNISCIPYDTPSYDVQDNITVLKNNGTSIPLCVFGEHNLQNIEGARKVCNQLGIDDTDFYKAIQSFKGASKRLQLLAKDGDTNIYSDFAHSPSKLKATTSAVKEQFKNRKLIACIELHTFSSLKKDFLPQYKGSMAKADEAIVYFNKHTIEHKKLPPIDETTVKEAFGLDSLKVYTDNNTFLNYLLGQNWDNTNLLLMSSGNFSGLDLKEIASQIIATK